MLVVEVLDGKKHNRSPFDCGNILLNDYIKTKASQDVKDGYCQVYVVTDHLHESLLKSKYYIYGFFSLSPYTIEHHKIDQSLLNKRKYKSIPAILLGIV